ncbi:class I SAM-dependent methyltransferase [Nonomuraea sp. NPDC059194]|uniref:class I SAM-dependent methyltransferase n=1 Tax=Nonomuraea sp. NPDC059194 TaxID=3346764 RepID=UPI0036C37A10
MSVTGPSRALGRVFDRVADAYDAARPGYPDELFRALGEMSGVELAGATVVDVGAGTGISARALRERGARVVALDPGREMLARLVARDLPVSTAEPRAEDLPGDGTALPLAPEKLPGDGTALPQAPEELPGDGAAMPVVHQEGDGATMPEGGPMVAAVQGDGPRVAAVQGSGSRVAAVQGDGNVLPIRDGSADLVTYAQSWHWLDPAVSVAEARRVLRDGGAIAAWWNTTDAGQADWLAAYEVRLAESCPTYWGPALPEWGVPRIAAALPVEERWLHWTRLVAVDDFLLDLRSHSYMVTMAAEAADELVAMQRAELLRVFPEGVLTVPMRVYLAVGR